MNDSTAPLIAILTALVYPRIYQVVVRLKEMLKGVRVRVVVDAHIEVGVPVQPDKNRK